MIKMSVKIEVGVIVEVGVVINNKYLFNLEN